ncbi:lysylphosphatidylglycerol synthase domain-containing protein [Phytohabitans sp. ZYX-F-186]|uniref:Lysylphosphatidylglycerol synthase domain-containing protein n=1 Tax=Phytohabitans maris TaxID=3071409 RepID=A0ABU0ZP86_9ACTN|nr:lysylphosphatidylglycerol synthase domain-containing protein [Phytohabitans sp. ZYX-F-186]MDQ7908849.1 lysylphosphatidylglycerol synthase domain-containing protein [Phytohabitans sp. ZYX-F-186]
MTVSDEASEAGPVQPRPASSWRSRLRVAVLVVVLLAAAAAIARNWGELVDALRELSPWAVVAASPFSLGAMVVSLFTWRSLMTDFGAPLRVGDAARIFYLSQLGKYIPGSIWSMISQAELARDLHVPRRTTLTVGVLTIVIAEGVGLPLAIVTLPFAAPSAAERYWWIALVAPLFLVVLHPKLLTRLVNLALRVVRRPPLDHPPSWRGLLRTAGLQVVVWLMFGMSAWVLVVGLGGSPGAALPAAIGGYALAHCVGLLAVGLPAGAGVRDLALAAALAAVLSAPQALVVALVARMIITVVDLLLATIQIRRRAGSPARASV